MCTLEVRFLRVCGSRSLPRTLLQTRPVTSGPGLVLPEILRGGGTWTITSTLDCLEGPRCLPFIPLLLGVASWLGPESPQLRLPVHPSAGARKSPVEGAPGPWGELSPHLRHRPDPILTCAPCVCRQSSATDGVTSRDRLSLKTLDDIQPTSIPESKLRGRLQSVCGE